MFEALSFDLAAGDAWSCAGPTAAASRPCCGCWPASCGRARAVSPGTGGPSPPTRRSIGRRLHFVGHADPLKSLLSVAENLALRRRSRPAARRLVGRGARRASTSGAWPRRRRASSPPGQKRRANLARLLATPRPLWLLDEPGVGLDSGQPGAAGAGDGGPSRAAAASACSPRTATSPCATPMSSTSRAEPDARRWPPSCDAIWPWPAAGSPTAAWGSPSSRGPVAVPVRRRRLARHPGPDRRGRGLGGGAPGRAAHPRPALAGRLRGRLARAHAALALAARAPGGGEVPRALADDRPAAGGRLAAAGADDEPAVRGRCGRCPWHCSWARRP